MITINNIEFIWQKGMTLEGARKIAVDYSGFDTLKEYKLMTMHNGLFIAESALDDTLVNKGDVILFMPVVSGG